VCWLAADILFLLQVADDLLEMAEFIRSRGVEVVFIFQLICRFSESCMPGCRGLIDYNDAVTATNRYLMQRSSDRVIYWHHVHGIKGHTNRCLDGIHPTDRGLVAFRRRVIAACSYHLPPIVRCRDVCETFQTETFAAETEMRPRRKPRSTKHGYRYQRFSRRYRDKILGRLKDRLSRPRPYFFLALSSAFKKRAKLSRRQRAALNSEMRPWDGLVTVRD